MVEIHNGQDQTDADDDLSTTPPNPVTQTNPIKSPAEKWEMPKPVFRRSGGYDPLAVREEFEAFEDTTAVPNKILEEAAELTAARRSDEAGDPRSSAVVEPQPDVLGSLAEPTQPASVVSTDPPKGGAGRIITILLVILASIAIIAIFLFIVMYLFLSKSGDGGF